MTKKLVFLALSALFVNGVRGQSTPPLPCLSDDPAALEAYFANDPEGLQRIAQSHAELEEFTREFEASGAAAQRNTYIIPVVFHVIHNNGPENISDEQLIDAIRVLNNDFNKLNSDWPNVKPEFLDLVANVGVEFRLARKDPQGNCTNGITRTVSTRTYDGDQAMKDLIQWPRNRYLNVWVAASANGAAGYTYRPGAVNNSPSLDGIVQLHNYTGSIGTASPYTSRTLTHEVGHWINLAHTWGNSNNSALSTNCNDDDGVADTPNTIGWTSCNLNGNSCGSLDNVENYMDYSYCSKMFTIGQATRMLAALNAGTAQRNQLWQPSNLAFTGVEGEGVLCMARFSSTAQSVCSGSVVDFSDLSYHNVVERTWNFPGGQPETSNASNPSVTYTTPGVYPVSLTVSDGTNSMVSTETSYITVLANPGTEVPFDDGFEDYQNLSASPWTVVNPDGDNGFELTDAAAFSGQNSVRLVNINALSGRKDELVSTTYDMSGVSSIRITFRYAFAQRNSADQDRLRLYVSNNCGRTWSMRQQLRAETNLTTGGVMSGSFVPADAGQWGFSDVTNISSAYHTSDFRFKLEFESAGGNNLYIDDININGSPVSVGEVLRTRTDLRVVPNPAKEQARVLFELGTAGPVSIELIDVLGRQLQTLYSGSMPVGPQRLDLPVTSLQSGLYFVRLIQGVDAKVVRFIVE
jgi:PKD repeat protein